MPTEARQKKGMDKLLEAIHDVASGNFICKPHKVVSVPSKIKKILKDLIPFTLLFNLGWGTIIVFNGDPNFYISFNFSDLSKRRTDSLGVTSIFYY